MPRYSLLYACAQKNAGIAGVTVVIVRDEFLKRANDKLPPMLDYRLQAKNDSLYNTPPVFGIYILMLVGRWLRDEIGGLANMAASIAKRPSCCTTCWTATATFTEGTPGPTAART